MHIGVDAARAFEPEPTGTEAYTRALIERLPRIGPEHRFTYFVAKRPTESFPKNVRIEVLRWPLHQLWHQLRLSARLVSRRPDVLFVPAHTVPLWHPLPTVTTIHDIGFEDSPELYDRRPLGSGAPQRIGNLALRLFSFGRYGATELDYHRWSLRQALRAQAILTVSRFTAKRIHARFPSHPPLVPIPNGFSRDASSAAAPPLPFPYVLYVGRLERKKNLVACLATFSAWIRQNPGRPEHLVLVGKPGYGFDEAKALLATLPLAERVVQLGWQPDSRVAALFAHARALLFLSAYEGFGIPVLQAMAAGVPVLASDIPALREVAGEAAMFASPDDPDAAAAALNRILTDSALRERLRELGRVRAKRFDWDHCAAQTIAALTAVGEGRVPAGALPT